MDLTDLIPQDSILPSLRGRDKASIVAEMAGFLIQQGKLPSDQLQEAIAGILAREKQLSTFIGLGLCIPHAGIPSMHGLAVALARVPEGVDWDSPDGAPGRLFILLIYEEGEATLHLKNLAALAKFFSRPGVIEKILAAPGEAEIYQLLKN